MQSIQQGDNEPVKPGPSVPEAVPAVKPEVPSTDDDVVIKGDEDDKDPVNPEPTVTEPVPVVTPEVPATDDDVVITGDEGDDGRDAVHVPDPKKSR